MAKLSNHSIRLATLPPLFGCQHRIVLFEALCESAYGGLADFSVPTASSNYVMQNGRTRSASVWVSQLMLWMNETERLGFIVLFWTNYRLQLRCQQGVR